VRGLEIVSESIVGFVELRLTNIMASVGGRNAQLQQGAMNQAVKILKFLSGALQLLDVSLCERLVPLVMSFASIDDAQIKINAYLGIEVLFASRRFGSNLTAINALKTMLDNAEAVQVADDAGLAA
jgi:hypothetical protein